MVVVQQNVMLVNVSPVEAQTEALEADTHTHRVRASDSLCRPRHHPSGKDRSTKTAIG